MSVFGEFIFSHYNYYLCKKKSKKNASFFEKNANPLILQETKMHFFVDNVVIVYYIICIVS